MWRKMLAHVYFFFCLIFRILSFLRPDHLFCIALSNFRFSFIWSVPSPSSLESWQSLPSDPCSVRRPPPTYKCTGLERREQKWLVQPNSWKVSPLEKFSSKKPVWKDVLCYNTCSTVSCSAIVRNVCFDSCCLQATLHGLSHKTLPSTFSWSWTRHLSPFPICPGLS